MGNIDELRKRLFRQRETFEERGNEPELPRPDITAPRSWMGGGEPLPQKQQSNMRVLSWIIVAAAVLLIGGVLTLFFLLERVRNVGAQNVDIRILSVSSITAGDAVTFEVQFKNNDETALESVELVFDYPPGAIPLFGKPPERGRFRERIAVGTLAVNEERTERFEVYLFGKEGAELPLRALLEYRPAGSSARFAVEATHTVVVASSPLGLTLATQEEARPGEEIEIELTYLSSADALFEDISVGVEYPPGFTFISSSPAPSRANNIWRLGDLAAGAKGTISIQGRLEGEVGEAKHFDVRLGVFDEDTMIWNVYAEHAQEVRLRSSLLAITALVNGSTEHVANPGEGVSVSLAWRNNLPVSVKNVRIEADIAGEVFNYVSVKVEAGSFDGAHKRIVWNAFSNEALRFVEPGESGTVTFSGSVLPNLPIKKFDDKNFIVSVKAIITTSDAPEGFEGVDIAGRDEVTFRVATRLGFASRGYYFSNVIANTGPLPPRVGEETTYTITWSLTNLSNDMENVIVEAGLPSYMHWKGVLNPMGAAIAYDPEAGDIVWNVANLVAGTGITRPALEVEFQVGLVAGPNLQGRAPTLVPQATASGRDAFTGIQLTAHAPEVTTALRSDPKVLSSQYNVQ